ncbi:hypothetical protein AOLI_G00157320 [Acnodon oligacanthus]
MRRGDAEHGHCCPRVDTDGHTVASAGWLERNTKRTTDGTCLTSDLPEDAPHSLRHSVPAFRLSGRKMERRSVGTES